MATIWVVSENAALAQALAAQLRRLGETRAGPPERGAWREEQPPDLLVAVATGAAEEALAGLERLLGFLRSVPAHRRAPTPVLYLEAPGGRPPAALARSLIDDRPIETAPWPLEPGELGRLAAALLDAPRLPVGLRERARREWVARRVELLHAGLELVPLRQAIDPRNAARPVLLAGEPGTGKSLLARYIHNLAEPPRDRLVILSAGALEAGRVEARILDACAGRRVSLHLRGLEQASEAVQDEIADLLGQGGGLAIEAIRWIGSSARTRQLRETLRALPWIRVELPALRDRPDLEDLAQALCGEVARRRGREARLGEDALAAVRGLAWTGNLRELEEMLEAGVAGARGPVIGAAELQGAPAPAPQTQEEPGREPEEPDRAAPVPTPSADREAALTLPEILAPLARELRQRLLAIRTSAGLLQQRPDDADLRADLGALADRKLPELEDLLAGLEQFSRFGTPEPGPLDLAALIESELAALQPRARERQLVILRELEAQSPPAIADPEQLRFALRGLLRRALRMVPPGGDLYLGSHHHPASRTRESRHRLLIRFHSPEEVLVAPEEAQGPPIPLEVLMARALILRMQGSFAVDSSGEQDNVILIELPAGAGIR